MLVDTATGVLTLDTTDVADARRALAGVQHAMPADDAATLYESTRRVEASLLGGVWFVDTRRFVPLEKVRKAIRASRRRTVTPARRRPKAITGGNDE